MFDAVLQRRFYLIYYPLFGKNFGLVQQKRQSLDQNPKLIVSVKVAKRQDSKSFQFDENIVLDIHEDLELQYGLMEAKGIMEFNYKRCMFWNHTISAKDLKMICHSQVVNAIVQDLNVELSNIIHMMLHIRHLCYANYLSNG